MITGNIVECLRLLATAPESALVFLHNTQAFINDTIPAQAIWNLRDQWKAQGNTLIMLCTPGTTPPPQLKDDIITLQSSLPQADELKAIADSLTEDAKLSTLEGESARSNKRHNARQNQKQQLDPAKNCRRYTRHQKHA